MVAVGLVTAVVANSIGSNEMSLSYDWIYNALNGLAVLLVLGGAAVSIIGRKRSGGMV